jgi:hypothetical protein
MTMGFQVSTVRYLPEEGIDFYVHVIDATRSMAGQLSGDKFREIGERFGRHAGLVTGPEDFRSEVLGFLDRNLKSGEFYHIRRLLEDTPCLLISEGHLAKTDKPICLVPVVVPGMELNKEFLETLLNEIADAIQRGRLHEFLKSLGVSQYVLKASNGNFWVCMLRNLNKLIELKPGLAGVAININEMIERLLPPDTRAV